MNHPPGEYPEVIRDPEQFDQRRPYVSIDFEFDPENPTPPTIAGFSSGAAPVSSVYNARSKALLERLERERVTWLGHFSLTTERQIIESELGVKIPLDRMEDTRVLYFLANSHLTKNAAKGGEDEDERGQGFMDLWSMASLYTDLPQWKQCRGLHCSGPCWLHDKLGYNGVDAYAVDRAYGPLLDDLARKRVPRTLINHVKEMVEIGHAMETQGIAINRDEVYRLEREMAERKAKLFPSEVRHKIGKKGQELKTTEVVWDAPFNPRSPQAVLEYFGEHGVYLESTEKDEIARAIDHLPAKADPEVRRLLENLYDYKQEGKGLGPWFDDRYFHRDGLIHSRFNPTGSSLGRLSSADPNFQNIPRVGFGKNVRRVVIPRTPGLILVKADKSQLELRMVLWYAGVYDKLPYSEDAFAWLVQAGNGVFEQAEEIAQKGWTPRDHAKSVSHGADYLEGVKLYTSRDLDSPRIRRMIEDGAIVLYRDWEYHGGLIGFTGINLATRLFGNASMENRRKANQIQEAYFSRFPEIRRWHKSLSRDAESGAVRSASGRYLELYGSPEDKLKIAAAFYGQGGGADDVQEGMIRYWRAGYTPLIQVHDELVFEFPENTPDAELLDFFSLFTAESKFMPGFRGPVKVSKGPNWLDMTTIGKI
jgi:hypothetical protein